MELLDRLYAKLQIRLDLTLQVDDCLRENSDSFADVIIAERRTWRVGLQRGLSPVSSCSLTGTHVDGSCIEVNVGGL